MRRSSRRPGRRTGAEIVPVDSEHCAIHQCLGERRHLGPEVGAAGFGVATEARPPDVRRLVVTASGGPFRGRTPGGARRGRRSTQALAHPTWKMGPKITIDSSTLMNKGLEVIEAHELFGVGYDRIEVVVHPAVDRPLDGRVLRRGDDRPALRAGHAPADRLRPRLSRAAPAPVRRASTGAGSAGSTSRSRTSTTFACLGLAYEAGRDGGSAPAWLNAANEVAVEAFLAGRIGWLAIAEVVGETLDAHEATKLVEVEDVLAADAAARRAAEAALTRRGAAG